MREFTVLAETDLRTPEQFNSIIIRDSGGYPVRLRDIGRAEVGAEDERNIVRVNGKPAVGLGIVKQSTANTLEVAARGEGRTAAAAGARCPRACRSRSASTARSSSRNRSTPSTRP